MSFRENLQHMRAAHNMTQEQLAMLLGVSRQSVTKWESEKSYPEMDKLLRMCQIFDCTLDELVQGDLTGRPVEPAASVAPGTPPVDVVGYDEHMRGVCPQGLDRRLFHRLWCRAIDTALLCRRHRHV